MAVLLPSAKKYKPIVLAGNTKYNHTHEGKDNTCSPMSCPVNE